MKSLGIIRIGTADEIKPVHLIIIFFTVELTRFKVEYIPIKRNVKLVGQCSIYLELNLCPKSLMVSDAFPAAVPIADCVCLDASSAADYTHTHT